MKIIGIDPGTAIVGYGVIEYSENKYKLLDYGCIFTDKELEMPLRLEKIYDGIDNLIKLYKPESVAVEELFYFKNNKTIISVGQARGVILLAAQKNNTRSYGYTPLQVKMGITGYGKSDKRQVQEMVKRVLGLKEIPKPDDAADGLAIAITHINSMKSSFVEGKRSFRSIKRTDISTGSKLSIEDYRNMLK